MKKATLTFSSGEKLELEEGQFIIPISKIVVNEDQVGTSQCETYEIWIHSSAGLIPSITEFLCSCDFFHLIDNENKVYKSSAVVTIEIL